MEEDDEIPAMKAGFGDAVGFGLKKLEGRLGGLERRTRTPLQETEDKIDELLSTQKYRKFINIEKTTVKDTLMKVPNISYLNSEVALDAGFFIVRFRKSKKILTKGNLESFRKIIAYDQINVVRYIVYLEKYFKSDLKETIE